MAKNMHDLRFISLHEEININNTDNFYNESSTMRTVTDCENIVVGDGRQSELAISSFLIILRKHIMSLTMFSNQAGSQTLPNIRRNWNVILEISSKPSTHKQLQILQAVYIYSFRHRMQKSEVLVPSYTFPATVNAVVYTHLKSKFVDIELTNYNAHGGENETISKS